ncbi:MAG TPA: CHAT domain-containing protein, partial [Thermoanaerobaculia bacterium]|nr:CHAT domain-containing protein [Thermoanaerobaculia bacterium]
MSSRQPVLLLVLLAWALPAVPVRGLVTSASGFARCARQVVAHPEQRESALCFYLEVQKGGAKQQAARLLRGLLATYPQNPGLGLYSAILDPYPRDRAERLLRSAAAGFLHRDAAGEFLARLNLVDLLLDQGRGDEADLEIRRETAAAGAAALPSRARYLSLAKISRARLLAERGDFKQAGLLLDEIPEGPLRNMLWLSVANTVHTETGQLDRSWDECLQLCRLASGHGDRALCLYGKARVLIERTAELPGDRERKLAEQVARETAVEAEAGGNRPLAARAHWLLAMLAGDGESAGLELRRCLDVAPGESEKRLCLGALARYLASAGKVPSRELERAMHTIEPDDAVSRAQADGDQMRVSWKLRPFDVFVRDAEQALSDIERLRARQTGPEVQAGLFSTWSADYYWFSGRLLEAALAGRCPSCMDLAFGGMEQLRARTLHDVVAAAEAGSSAARPDGGRLTALDDSIRRVMERQRDSSLPQTARAEAETDARALSAAAARLRRVAAAGLASSAPSATTAAEARGFASLARVQALLAPDEAILSFQIAPWQDWTGDFGGGSWLIVATRTGRRCYRLGEMGRGDLRRGVADLFEHRLRSRPWQAVELHRQLLGPALAELPPGIKRLIVVPDDQLHGLPFAALRAAPESGPLASRYQISIVPSATLWVHWRVAPQPSPAARPGLVLADPPPPTPAVRKTFQAGGIRLPIEPLPAARREADALVRFLGWGCERRVDGAVSEAALLDQRAPLRRFALLHFAAHSIVDDRDPSRSGIWLSPSPGRDGLLQAADIVKLRLDDRLVVLATCSSNGGPFLRGEGVMSLAHAFFQARARTVVASLWPQVDTDEEA